MPAAARLLVGSSIIVAALAAGVASRGLDGAPASAARLASTAPAGQSVEAPATTAPDRQTFDSQRAWDHLRQLVAIGPRPAGSAEIRQARAYIGRQLADAGLTVQQQPFVADTPAGRVDMANLIVRIPGRRSDRLIIAGHYDTKLLDAGAFVGASDGASSAALLIELARVLAERQRELTYEIVWLDGEEAFCQGWSQCGTPESPDHTYGSRYYVKAAHEAGAIASIKAMVLVDMIGDRDLGLLRDTNSTPWLTDIIWSTARSLAYGHVFRDGTTAIEDDHLPFLAAGIPSVDLIDLDYPYWHTTDDTLERVSARSLQIVGDVLLESLPRIEQRLGGR